MEFAKLMDNQAFVIRPANLGDLEWFHSIAHMFGSGFTSLPNNKEFLKKRLTIVEQSFAEKIPVQERIYLFVRENLPDKKIVGTSGVDVSVGYKESFYNYQISTVTQSCEKLNKYVTHSILNLVNNYQQASELISFWIHPEFRGQGMSKSLSLCRFLFMAQFAQWFNHDIISEVRGVVDENGMSPFWDAVGQKFFDMTFKEADALTMTQGKQYIADLASREAIYVDLLPEAAQQVIGKEHPEAHAAYHLLQGQGFKFSNHIDIFDGGPLLWAERDHIKTVADNKIGVLANFADDITSGTKAMLYNNKLDARFTVADVIITSAQEIEIAHTTADILGIKVGDPVRYCQL